MPEQGLHIILPDEANAERQEQRDISSPDVLLSLIGTYRMDLEHYIQAWANEDVGAEEAGRRIRIANRIEAQMQLLSEATQAVRAGETTIERLSVNPRFLRAKETLINLLQRDNLMDFLTQRMNNLSIGRLLDFSAIIC